MNMRTFAADHVTDASLSIDVPHSPAGPVQILSWARFYQLPPAGSAIVLPLGLTDVEWPGVTMRVGAGSYLLVPGGAELRGGGGLIIYTPAYRGLPQAGGPVEAFGRLRYIDGCSDSLLVCPALLGEPCLNLLHLPAGVDQTAHTHPSERIGIILRGRGFCRTLDGDFPLAAGMFWHIPAECVHSFHTPTEALDVFAWHPDSDFGPSHDAHPMLNRTIVEGVAVSDPRHAGIRTETLRQ